VNDPVRVDRPLPLVDGGRTLRSIPLPAPEGDADAARLADDLAAALRAVRGYVPHQIWWEAGPAQALLAYHAIQGS